MVQDFQGKLAVVTGAAAGIGAGLAEGYASSSSSALACFRSAVSKPSVNQS